MNKAGLWWGILVLWCVAAFVVESEPTSFFSSVIVVGVALVLALTWLVRLIVAVRSSDEGRGQRLSSLGLEALIGLAVVGICYLEVPKKVRFRLSEPALTAYAKQQLAHPSTPKTPLRIGLYTFRRIETTQEEVHLEMGNRFFDSVGFSYSLKYPSKDLRDFYYEHIRGSWYERTDLW